MHTENERSILHLSYYDPLTNLYNRRFYQEKLNELEESGNPFTLITCDINGLKLMNDAFGHEAGDDLLKLFATYLKEVFSDTGFATRIGGDEFVVLLPEKDSTFAQERMEKIITQLDSEKLYGSNVSVSYGISMRKENQEMTDTIRISEEEMYKHKLFETRSHRSEFIKKILKSLHEKNPREEEHSERVAKISVEMGKKLGMSKTKLNFLNAISKLHDIGKIAIDESILNKPGKLTEEEWDIIRRHPEIGFRIISTAPEYSDIAYDILSHHERYDGTGYPRGLKGEDIPISARIVAIADAFDAMISQRTYRPPLSEAEAIAEIKRCSGTQFDPKLVKIFLELYDANVF